MSKKKKSLLPSCEEAKQICDKMQYGEATLIERLKLRFRQMWCRATQSYSKKNSDLTQLCKEAKIKTLDNEKKVEMKRKIDGFS
ncbi:hypothetical protein [Galbibacter sp.]|jgi:hypothetical protein|uniref:hypothetical protein n=1 Tax=Galbibacter sp. TaxID=2918471 RepID=UPI003A950642